MKTGPVFTRPGPLGVRCFWQLDRGELLGVAAPPREAYAQIGTDAYAPDVDGDLEILWAVIKLLKPDLAIEIGTRQAVSTRTIVHAMQYAGCSRRLVTIDPDPACKAYLRGVNCTFLQAMGEEIFTHPVYSKHYAAVDFLFIDTDPHTYDQTWRWLDTWVQRVTPGGVVAFHDIVPARPEIQVADAIRDWLKGRAGWMWCEYPSPGTGAGIGLLWRLPR